MTYKTDWKACTLGCSIVLMLVVMAPLGYMAGGAYTEALPRPFDSASWIAGKDIQDERRCGMLVDLRIRVGLIGKSRQELTGLLGNPQSTDDGDASSWLLCPSFADIWALKVRWENGRAVEAIVHDT